MIIEVFAEITCPFAYVGLEHVVAHVAELDAPIDVVVRAWPLEWVNGTGLDVAGVQVKAAALCEQLDVHRFAGLRPDQWPSTTIPAHALAAAAYDIDPATGLAISMALRTALFELGADISDPATLAAIAGSHGVAFDAEAPVDERAVRADFELGTRRKVTGSPHFFVGDDNFFCPALDLTRDADDHLIARFDPDGLGRFLACLER